jgi:hypothetical protein
LIAEQAGWTTLEHPLVASPGFGAPDASGIPQSALYVDETGAITSDPVNPLALLLNATLPVPYDNLGVPGAATIDLLSATDAASSLPGNNLYFDLILRNSALPPGNQTAMDQMSARNPNVLTLWIGSNDVLGGAVGGQPEWGVNVTPPSFWEPIFLAVANAVDATNAQIKAVANVPDVTSIPFVTTVPLGTTIQGVGFVRWQMEEDTPADSVQFVLLRAPVTDPDSAVTYLPPPFGTGERALSGEHTLTDAEVALLVVTVDAYNAVIAREANDRGWGHADIHAVLGALPNDPTNPANLAVINAIFPWFTNPLTFQNALSAFSLDGVHPSELGQGLAANAFITGLNDAYPLEIPLVDLTGIQNTVGFEQAPTTAARAWFDEGGLRGLANLAAWLGSGP